MVLSMVGFVLLVSGEHERRSAWHRRAAHACMAAAEQTAAMLHVSVIQRHASSTSPAVISRTCTLGSPTHALLLQLHLLQHCRALPPCWPCRQLSPAGCGPTPAGHISSKTTLATQQHNNKQVTKAG
jgi:hypothetical protein